MHCEAYEDQLFFTCDLTTQDWRKIKWMQYRLEEVYDMRLDYEWKLEFLVMEPCDPTPARTLKAWFWYQSEVYEREMRKAVPFANPQWKASKFT